MFLLWPISLNKSLLHSCSLFSDKLVLSLIACCDISCEKNKRKIQPGWLIWLLFQSEHQEPQSARRFIERLAFNIPRYLFIHILYSAELGRGVISPQKGCSFSSARSGRMCVRTPPPMLYLIYCSWKRKEPWQHSEESKAREISLKCNRKHHWQKKEIEKRSILSWGTLERYLASWKEARGFPVVSLWGGRCPAPHPPGNKTIFDVALVECGPLWPRTKPGSLASVCVCTCVCVYNYDWSRE